jgi:hypothetical protein
MKGRSQGRRASLPQTAPTVRQDSEAHAARGTWTPRAARSAREDATAGAVARPWEGRPQRGKARKAWARARASLRESDSRGGETLRSRGPAPVALGESVRATERGQSAGEDRWRRRDRIPREEQRLEGSKLMSVAGLKDIRHASRESGTATFRATGAPGPRAPQLDGPFGAIRRERRNAGGGFRRELATPPRDRATPRTLKSTKRSGGVPQWVARSRRACRDETLAVRRKPDLEAPSRSARLRVLRPRQGGARSKP